MTNTSSSFKKLRSIQSSVGSHWVGDGFPVRTLFSYPNLEKALSPFLLFDYAGPMMFEPTTKRLGVGEHPHRGFETVTIVYSGEVEHRDSAGGGGKIGPGDVQWMTAASGVVHEEFHGRHFALHGGLFEVVQLWVNLPAKNKMEAPRYQGITREQIPTVSLPGAQGRLRVIAGQYNDVKGPAITHTPINVWDIQLNTEHPFDLVVPKAYTTLLAVIKGELKLNESDTLKAAEVGLFDLTGDIIRMESAKDVTALLLNGQPIDEPVAGSGPFVMNTHEEIMQAITDYRDGKMGHLS